MSEVSPTDVPAISTETSEPSPTADEAPVPEQNPDIPSETGEMPNIDEGNQSTSEPPVEPSALETPVPEVNAQQSPVETPITSTEPQPDSAAIAHPAVANGSSEFTEPKAEGERICPKCGKNNDRVDSYCFWCGESLV
jgi:hypothetical protein